MPHFGKSDKPVIKDERLKFIADKLNAFMAALRIEKATHWVFGSIAKTTAEGTGN
jgi:hypothetical protein